MMKMSFSKMSFDMFLDVTTPKVQLYPFVFVDSDVFWEKSNIMKLQAKES